MRPYRKRTFTREFKLAAVRRLEEGEPIEEVAHALDVKRHVLGLWRREFDQYPADACLEKRKRQWTKTEIAELERKINQAVF